MPIVTEEMVTRFLNWPLPDSVHVADLCAQRRGKPGDDRRGTNLLTATEARLMLEYVLQSELVEK